VTGIIELGMDDLIHSITPRTLQRAVVRDRRRGKHVAHPRIQFKEEPQTTNRLLKNREYACRSRERKKERIATLQKRIAELEEENAQLRLNSPNTVHL
jgi:hypothetical protein